MCSSANFLQAFYLLLAIVINSCKDATLVTWHTVQDLANICIIIIQTQIGQAYIEIFYSNQVSEV